MYIYKYILRSSECLFSRPDDVKPPRSLKPQSGYLLVQGNIVYGNSMSRKHVSQDLWRVRNCTQEKANDSGYSKKEMHAETSTILAAGPCQNCPFPSFEHAWKILTLSLFKTTALSTKKTRQFVYCSFDLFGHWFASATQSSAYVVCPATQIQDYYAAATDSVEDFQNRLPGERNVGGSYTI